MLNTHPISLIRFGEGEHLLYASLLWRLLPTPLTLIPCSFILFWKSMKVLILRVSMKDTHCCFMKSNMPLENLFLLHTHVIAYHEQHVQEIIVFVLFMLVWYKGEEYEGSRVTKVDDSHWCTLLGTFLQNGFGLIPKAINRRPPPSLFIVNLQECCECTLNSREHLLLGLKKIQVYRTNKSRMLCRLLN